LGGAVVTLGARAELPLELALAWLRGVAGLVANAVTGAGRTSVWLDAAG
jgi:hypothetical protein